jgi:predicted nucleotide-binding protein
LSISVRFGDGRASLINRYRGPEGTRLLVEALRAQHFIEGDEGLAAALSEQGILEEFEANQRIITQGASDNDLILIVSGQVTILVNGRKVSERRAGQHVGEMALIDPSVVRSATVVAQRETVVLRIAEPAFSRIADSKPRIWRLLSLEIARRLRERGNLIKPPNDKPHVFIGSSREALPLAREIESALERDDLVVKLWTNGVFGASATVIESLESTARLMDFAVLVLSPDDKILSRDKEHIAPRDNVIFELGLFMGALNRNRTFVVFPRSADLKIPSDLAGVTFEPFEEGASETLTERLAPICTKLRAVFNELGQK